TSCTLSARRVAVTITSCSSPPVPVAVVVSAAAQTTAVAGALRMAATVAEIFGLGFITHSPGFVVIFPRQARPAWAAASLTTLLYQSLAWRLNKSVIQAAGMDRSIRCLRSRAQGVARPQHTISARRASLTRRAGRRVLFSR